MRSTFPISLSVVLLLAATPALASFGGGDKTPPPPSSSSPPPEAGDNSKSARQEAESWYQDAYNDVAKGKRELEEGKTKNAQKRFRKAVERAQRAVEIDPTYYEAWNLVGYGSRSIGQYDQALAAYDKCLKIKPDYAPAREYLAEAYLLVNQPQKAREQVAWLEKSGATEELARFKAAWDDWAKKNPAASAAMSAPPGTTTAVGAASDSTSSAQKP